MTNGSLMKVKSIAECSPLEHSAIILTCIKKNGFENHFVVFLRVAVYTGFTVAVLKWSFVSFEYPQHMIWLRKIGKIILKYTLLSGGSLFLKDDQATAHHC